MVDPVSLHPGHQPHGCDWHLVSLLLQLQLVGKPMDVETWICRQTKQQFSMNWEWYSGTSLIQASEIHSATSLKQPMGLSTASGFSEIQPLLQVSKSGWNSEVHCMHKYPFLIEECNSHSLLLQVLWCKTDITGIDTYQWLEGWCGGHWQVWGRLCPEHTHWSAPRHRIQDSNYTSSITLPAKHHWNPAADLQWGCVKGNHSNKKHSTAHHL